MHLSAQYLELIQSVFRKREAELSRLNPKLAEAMSEAEGHEAVLMRFYIGHMTNTDLINLDFDTLLDFAKESLLHMGADEKLPEDIWLNYVAWYRVNTESIVKHRAFFREQLMALDLGETLEERILRVNEWCAEQVSYRSTDTRTLNPLALFGKVYGRCGEESTFLVSCLRSIGIPARQIYAPWWSHCDDNHAWVEVWTGKDWVFLGACEPEPILNRGWFTEAASRAMLVIARAVIPPASEKLLPFAGKDLLINRLPFYAKALCLDLRLLFGEDVAAGAECRLEVFNYGAFASLTRLLSDSSGSLRLYLGRGSFRLICHYRGHLYQEDIYLQDDLSLSIDLSSAPTDDRPEVGVTEVDFIAPKAASVHHRPLTKAEQKARAETLLRANQKREEKLERLSYAKERRDLVERFPEVAVLSERLVEARAHFPVIAEFIEKAATENQLNEAIAILASLSLKDFSDVSPEVLRERLNYVPKWRIKRMPSPDQDETVWPSVYSPRVEIESLDLIYGRFAETISEEERQAFVQNPEALRRFVEAHCAKDSGTKADRYRTELAKLWEIGAASEHEKEMLFVSLARFCHLPAKLALSDGRARFFQENEWKTFEETKPLVEPSSSAHVELEAGTEVQWRYQINWSLDYWSEEAHAFVSLRALDYPVLDSIPATLPCPAGYYRMNTNNRLPNGNCLVHSETFYFAEGDRKKISLCQRAAGKDDLLLQIPLDPISFFYDQAGAHEGENICSLMSEDYGLLLWIDPMQEPSVHVLAELLEHQEEMRRANLPITMVLSPSALPNCEILDRVRQALPHITMVFGEAEEAVARQVYINPDLLPRTLLVSRDALAHYAEAGYKVGQVPLILDLLEILRENT